MKPKIIINFLEVKMFSINNSGVRALLVLSWCTHVGGQLVEANGKVKPLIIISDASAPTNWQIFSVDEDPTTGLMAYGMAFVEGGFKGVIGFK